jgi:hypothetical protein
MTEVDGAVVLGSLLASVVINVRPSRRSSVPPCDNTVYNGDNTVYNGGGKWRMREEGRKSQSIESIEEGVNEGRGEGEGGGVRGRTKKEK